jgi:hypothetical protein
MQTMFDAGAPAGMLAYWRTEYLGELSDGARTAASCRGR